MKYSIKLLFSILAFTSALVLLAQTTTKSPSLPPDSRCFEMRVYYPAPGKFEELNARFRDHTNKLFVKHGITLIGYWVPGDKGVPSEEKLIYILAFPSKEAREQSWKAFGQDPAWKEVVKTTEANGKLVTKVESTIMNATDYSPIK